MVYVFQHTTWKVIALKPRFKGLWPSDSFALTGPHRRFSRKSMPWSALPGTEAHTMSTAEEAMP
jgi:hypothetical protein